MDVVKRIRDILLNDWDPIGISENPNLSDEYDAYISRIVKLVTKNSSIGEIAHELELIETNSLGVSTSSECKLAVARMLRALGVGKKSNSA